MESKTGQDEFESSMGPDHGRATNSQDFLLNMDVQLSTTEQHGAPGVISEAGDDEKQRDFMDEKASYRARMGHDGFGNTREVDEEVRSIIEQLNDTSISAVEERGASYVRELEEEMRNRNGTSPNNALGHSFLPQRTAPTDWEPPEAGIQEDKLKASTISSTEQIYGATLTSSSSETPAAGRPTNLTINLDRMSLPPAPEPEVRFNFHLFLEQLRHRTADPVARYLRSFLFEFGKKQWAVREQVRIISDFLTFIGSKMAQCEVWRQSTEAEFDNAKEGMEKLVMNRLYGQTFSPEIPPLPLPLPDARGRRKLAKAPAAGRRGQHQEDVERDHVLAERMQIFSWVEEQHLDIPPIAPEGKRFLALAQQELLKINNYRAPRDKVICILNACKVIFGLLRSSTIKDTSADSFMPLLIYTVLHAKPRHMVSNIQYIFRFRNQEKLGGEAGYYLSSLMGAVQFIENIDRTALTISDEDFEKYVEASVAAITERQPVLTPVQHSDLNSIPGAGADGPSTGSRPPSRLGTGDGNNPVQGILRNLQRPLSNIGRIFSEDPGELDTRGTQIGTDARSTPGGENHAYNVHNNNTASTRGQSRQKVRTDVDVDKIVETLSSMFPSLDKDVISDIVIAKEARVGAAVDACLSLTS